MARLHDAAGALHAAARKADDLVERQVNAQEAAEDGSSDDEYIYIYIYAKAYKRQAALRQFNI